MPDERRSLTEIDTLARELNQLDDALGQRIQALEKLLNQHNPGTRVSFGVFEGGEIRWGKHSGHWRFLWVSTDGTVPMSGTPRHVRAAFSHMVDDVDRILTIVVDALKAEIKLRGLEKPP
jgi:hypothetical protein